MGPKTDKSVNPVNHVNGTPQCSPRGTKRTRDTATEDNLATKNQKASNKATTRVAGFTDAAAEASPSPHGELPLDPGRRRSRRTAQPANQQSSCIQSAEASQEPPSLVQSKTEYDPTALVSSPRDSRRKARGNILARPNSIRGAIKRAPSKSGECVFDVDSDSELEQRQTLTAAGSRPLERQSTRTGDIRATSAATQERSVQDSTAQQPTPKKRGRPRKSTKGQISSEDAVALPTRALRSEHQYQKKPPTTVSKKLRNSKISRKPVPAIIEAAEEVTEEEEHISNGEHENGQNASKEADQSSEYANDGTDAETDYQSTGTGNTESTIDARRNALALLGQADAWETILTEVRKNCPDQKLKGIGKKQAVHLTETVRNLSQVVKRARVQYTTLGKAKSHENAPSEAEKQTSQILLDIELKIKDIKKYDVSGDGTEKARYEGAEIIRDIYLRGVPDMIYLLRAAIDYHFLEDRNSYDTKGIQEIIRIQDMTLHLCRTAATWKQKPAVREDQRIVKHIKSVVFPKLRDDVRKAFAQEMQNLFVAERKRQNFEKRRAQLAQSAHSSQKKTELEAKQQVEVLHRITEDIKQTQDEYRAKLLGQDPQYNERRSVSLRPMHSGGTLWTQAEVKELLVQLQNRDSCYLPRKSDTLMWALLAYHIYSYGAIPKDSEHAFATE